MSPRIQQLEKEFEERGGKWKEYNLEKLFGKSTRGKRLKSSDRIVGDLPFVTAGEENTGISAFIGNDVEVFQENSITIDMFGSAKFRGYEFGADDHVAVVHTEQLQRRESQFIATAIHKVSYSGKFSYSRNFYAKDADELNISLPTLNKIIAFDYMDEYIEILENEHIGKLEDERTEKIEAYLTVTNLKDYLLTKGDKEILDKFAKLFDKENEVENSRDFQLSPVKMKTLFPHIYQGHRLKKDDQMDGMLPFVMAGTTNTGVVRNIGNNVRVFPKHSLTIDIFGNTFYRSYEFGAGDDTGVFWNDEIQDGRTLLYLKTVIEKSLLGKYNFGNKLRSSKTHDFQFYVPKKNNKKIDATFMADFIRVVEKIVIKDLIECIEKKIDATKEIVHDRR